MKYLIGIDLGTTQCKVALFDTEGNVVFSAYREIPMMRSRDGAAVHRPETWWDIVSTMLKAITRDTDPAEILGIGADSTQEGIVPVDANGNKLFDCMTWEDQRVAPQQEWIKGKITDDNLLKITGTTSTFSGSAPRALYFKQNLPEVYGKTYKFLSCKDYVNYKLSGAFTADWSTGGHTQLFDITKREWSAELIDLLGISKDKWPEVSSPSDVIGSITQQAAAETGLAEGTPVVAGAGDQEAAAIGTGAVKSGAIYELVGSADLVNTTSTEPVFNQQIQCFCHPSKGEWILTYHGGLPGQTLRWVRDNLGEIEVDAAERLGLSPYQIMDLEAEKTIDSPTDITFFPHMSCGIEGSIIFNLTLAHSRGELIRSIFEGSAFTLRYFLEVYLRRISSINPSAVIVAGGLAGSRIWRQIRADVTRKAIVLPRIREATVFGAALLAGIGTGAFKNVEEAASRVVQHEKIMPREHASANYDAPYATYSDLRRKLGIY